MKAIAIALIFATAVAASLYVSKQGMGESTETAIFFIVMAAIYATAAIADIR